MAATVIDPVCKMDVDPDTAAAQSEYQGVTYYFCAVGCKQEFDTNPQKYLDGGAPAEMPAEHPAAAPAAPAGARKRWWEFWKA